MTALYRKYRPQGFDEVVGQEAVVRTLQNAIEHGQVRQAYLFAPTADFSRTVLESPALDLSVAEVPTHTWCDLGTPARVAWTLRALGAPPPAWIDRLGATS